MKDFTEFFFTFKVIMKDDPLVALHWDIYLIDFY